eukprot:gene25593-59332_t
MGQEQDKKDGKKSGGDRLINQLLQDDEEPEDIGQAGQQRTNLIEAARRLHNAPVPDSEEQRAHEERELRL